MRALFCLLLGLALLALSGPALAQQPVNPIHPPFAPLDADGKPAATSKSVSVDRTCGACHDATAIAQRNDHEGRHPKATCVDCHLAGGVLPFGAEHLDAEGKLRREDLRIGKPRADNCASCHGLIAGKDAPVLMPADFAASLGSGRRAWSLTLGEGAVVSPSHMASALLNLEGRDGLEGPWDVHAAKLVDCVGCHFARNDPARTESRPGDLTYVTADPRTLSTAEFLTRPDHRLAEPDCRSCHAAADTHGFLPYAARHMEALACTACHAPSPMGPAAQMIDSTVVSVAGGPAVQFRNVDARPGEPLDAASVHPLRPLLVMRADAKGVRRLGPVNLVTEYRWVSGVDRRPVPFGEVSAAWMDAGRVAKSVLSALDANHDGSLDDGERRLDTPAKAAVVAERLRQRGVVDPVIDGVIEVHPLAHGLPARERALRACGECHSAEGRLTGEYVVASYLPGGVSPRPPEKSGLDLAGTFAPTATGGLAFERSRESTPVGLHVLGRSRQALTNTVGFVLFTGVALALLVHGLVRVVLSRGRPTASVEIGDREVVFGRYERLWHWTMASTGVVLIVTGLVIHEPGSWWPFGMTRAVAWHNAAAVLFIANAFLSLFYHLSTAAIRNFIPAPAGLLGRVLEHLEFNTRGIFLGNPHPASAPEQKLNPLQQLTYLALLNVLFPFQIGTGALVWAVGNWPALLGGGGALALLAPLHNLGAWLFMTFFVLHVYLVTTGRTLGEHLSAMITGTRPAEGVPSAKGA